jgi:cellulose synthase/poly-beta-1,6-N-acetylglucosamine synthase-like glycosyltransferase
VFQLRLESARATARAATGFSDAFPHLSARTRLSPSQQVGFASLLGSVTTMWLLRPEAFGLAVMSLAYGLFVLVIGLRIAAAIAAMASRRDPGDDKVQPDADLPLLTVLAPMLREGPVVRNFVEAVSSLDYPASRIEVKLLVEGDDAETLDALEGLALPEHFEVLPIPPCEPRTKPKALNFGMSYARGEIIAVFDAEDIPSPGQPREAMLAFARGGHDLAVVQAPLVAHNGGRSWIAGQFALEYAIHFGVWLPFLTRLGWPMLLGGTSNYIRRSWLDRVGGWDPWNVTEDADLGIRIARAGGKSAMIRLPTLEEGPVKIEVWLPQRTRWLKGHLQTWLVVMRSPLWAMRNLGAGPFLGLQIVLAGSLLASLLHGPIVVWLLLEPLLSGAMVPAPYLVLFGAGYGSALAAALAAGRHSAPVTSMLWLPLYWPLQSIAMLRATWEFWVKPHSWSKTPHGA